MNMSKSVKCSMLTLTGEPRPHTYILISLKRKVIFFQDKINPTVCVSNAVFSENNSRGEHVAADAFCSAINKLNYVHMNKGF